MLTFMSVLVMLIVAYAFFREGLFTACATLVNVVLAGVITFNFWEPLAGALDSTLQGSILDGFQDFVMIMVLYALALGLLRMVTNNLSNSVLEFSPTLQQFGAAGVGLITGYLIAGFLICALETLPWHKNFMDFESKYASIDGKTRGESDFRRMLPPDRIWLALMRHAGAYAFARSEDNPDARWPDGSEAAPYDKYSTFDRAGTFELRYYRYRRYFDGEEPQRYLGELDHVLNDPVNRPLPAAQAVPPASVAPPAAQNPPPAPAKTPTGKSDTPAPGPDTGKQPPSK